MNLIANAIPRLAVLTVLVLSGCDGSRISSDGASRLASENYNGSGQFGTLSADPYGSSGGSQSGNMRIHQGTDEFLGQGASSRGPLFETSRNGSISLNLVNVGIEAAAKAVLGDALGLNYTIDPSVQGSVTLQTTRPLGQKTLLETFQTILELNNATLSQSGDLVKIVPFNEGARRISRLGENRGPGNRIVAAPLEFVGTSEMMELLTPIVGETVRLQASAGRNLLLISGTRDEINATIDAINLFDVNVLKGKSVALFRLKTADPDAVAQELSTIFDSTEGGALYGVIDFVPNQRLGSVLVITSRSKYLPEARNWIAQLDATAGGSRRRPVVYSLQNRSADELAPILSEMIETQMQQDEGEGVQSASTSQARVIADNAKNAVIVWGNDREQEDFARLVRTLDTVPVQVLLEATIAEVTLSDELEFGLRWYFENGNVSGAFSDLASGAVSSSFPGLSFLFQGPNARVSLNALSSVTDVRVVASPSLLVLDNQEATLQIGDEVPIATQQSQDTTNPLAPVINTISFRDTGITLTVRPRVSSSGRVILDIEQEVSTAKRTVTSGIDSPTISQRKIDTTVVVNNGATLALGGLIQDSVNDTRTQVPGAGDIPILGNLFRNKTNAVARTELLILITPRVIRDGSEARQVTEEFRRRLSGPDGLINDPGTAETLQHRILN